MSIDSEMAVTLGVCSCWVLVPMMTYVPASPNDNSVPPILIAPPLVRVCPLIRKSDDVPAVYVDPARVSTGRGEIADLASD